MIHHIRTKGFDRDQRLVIGARYSDSTKDKTASSLTTLCGAPISENDFGKKTASVHLQFATSIPKSLHPSWVEDVCQECSTTAKQEKVMTTSNYMSDLKLKVDIVAAHNGYECLIYPAEVSTPVALADGFKSEAKAGA